MAAALGAECADLQLTGRSQTLVVFGGLAGGWLLLGRFGPDE
jgi:hypothetical protein